MYSFFHELLSDKRGGEIFLLFGSWHLLYIMLALLSIVIAVFMLKDKSDDIRKKTEKILINTAFGLYVLDFFFMPLAYSEIDIEKLPFHVCTAMCVMCFLSYRISFLKRYRTSFVLMGFLSNLVYLIYPAGVMWHAVHPLSYRVVQTLLFHCVMTVYGFLAMWYECDEVGINKSGQDLLVVVCMTLWAMLGNSIYNGTSEGYSHFFNWFFVVRDPFYVLPETISPLVMPLLNVTLFFAVEVILRLIIRRIKQVKG